MSLEIKKIHNTPKNVTNLYQYITMGETIETVYKINTFILVYCKRLEI